MSSFVQRQNVIGNETRGSEEIIVHQPPSSQQYRSRKEVHNLRSERIVKKRNTNRLVLSLSLKLQLVKRLLFRFERLFFRTHLILLY